VYRTGPELLWNGVNVTIATSGAVHREHRVDRLSARERDVLALMAEGRSNLGISRRLWVSEKTVEFHVRSILLRLDIPSGREDHRRVLAVRAYLLGPGG
jgi:serine/threonine-protein kinase PknK